jgi:hypothetical protein
MKTVEIDIDHTASPQALAQEFKKHNLQRGDSLRLLSSKVDDNTLIIVAIAILVITAISIMHKEKIEYANKLLEDIFKDKNVQGIENDIKRIYDIDLMIDMKEDEEQQFWKQFSKSNLAKAYDHDEPEYDLSMVKEPNPRYKNGSR